MHYLSALHHSIIAIMIPLSKPWFQYFIGSLISKAVSVSDITSVRCLLPNHVLSSKETVAQLNWRFVLTHLVDVSIFFPHNRFLISFRCRYALHSNLSESCLGYFSEIQVVMWNVNMRSCHLGYLHPY